MKGRYNFYNALSTLNFKSNVMAFCFCSYGISQVYY